ncbi:MAG: exodeoxyribonuclease V subunit beta [Mycobacterium sp.]
MRRFDLLGELPAPGETIVLEASAGTGKTFALAGLVTRYLAEGVATLDQMLLITFSRAASQELRERVRGQIQEAVTAFADLSAVDDNELVAYLLDGDAEQRSARLRRLRDALAGFDAATIATTHQFCQLVLKSLGVAGDTDAGVTLVESLDNLVGEIVDDLYLGRFGQQPDDPPFTRAIALALAREVVSNPCAELRPSTPQAGSVAAVRLAFAADVLTELERRKRRLGILGYDDLLSRLAEALEADDSPARIRMRQRWSIVLVDEFQDTDPVQWQVIRRAFSGRSTLILIGDPKQAIYAFRGGDIVTYLDAARTAGDRQTLGVNWRSDAPLVDSLQTLLRGAALGDADIVVHDVDAHHREHRLVGAPHNAPFRLRVATRATFGKSGTGTIKIDRVRSHIVADLAGDIGALLASAAEFDGRPLRAADIAVIVEKHVDARVCHDGLLAAGIPAVYTGDTDVFASKAADDWLRLLEAFEQPNRSGLVRAAAVTMFFGETAESLASSGDELTDRVADTLRVWTDHARERGVAAVFEAAQLGGLGRRVLSWQGGERHMTDLAHLTQLLHDIAHRERFGLAALREWLETQRSERAGPDERNRRLDSDAAAVQIMTVWASKGLQYPVVYLPFAFNRNVQPREMILYHDERVRCLHIGGQDSADYRSVEELGKRESASDDIRLTYVALTRAQSQVVAWWAPSYDEPNGGLSRLLRRPFGQSAVPDRCTQKVSDADALTAFRRWEAAGGPVIEESVALSAVPVPAARLPDDLSARRFDRTIDTSWRRTSYSKLVRIAEAAGVSSEAELSEQDDESDVPADATPVDADQGADVASPMADLPGGAAFGSLVHAVLENADPQAPEPAAEFRDHVAAQAQWWPVEIDVDSLAAALLPMQATPLGPLAAGATLADIALTDRLRELDFEFPLAGGDLADPHAQDIRLSDVGSLMAAHLPATDPLAGYAARLTGPGFGHQSLRGYLSGSIDAVLRLPAPGGTRYLVVDYKTNRLGEATRPLTAADYGRRQLTAAMLHSDYPLQALLYSVVLHRFLRWRQPGYNPVLHLGGVLYLFVRGMCGPTTPVVDGHPAGVFSWQPPADLVTALSDLLEGHVVR